MSSEMNTRDYVIVGAGAIGGTLAFHLAKAGHKVLAVDTDAAHVAAVQRRGISILRNGVRESIAVAAATPSEAVIRDAARVLLCVKGVGTTEQAVDWIAPRLAADGFVVSMQNGLQVLRVADRVGAGRAVAAFVDFFADVVEPGLIVDGGAGTLRVGEIDGTSSVRVDQVVADLQAWGPARATTNIMGYLWSKLAFSAMLTATALVDLPMAEVIDRHRDLMTVLAGEVFRIARTRGVKLESFDSFDPAALMGNAAARSAGVDRLVAWLRQQSKTHSGVWRDIAVRHRPTEAAVRYTEVARDARDAGLTCPHIEALVEVLRELEMGRRGMSEDNFGLLRRRAAA